MGNYSVHPKNPDRPRKDKNTLQDLPETFKQHLNQVNAIRHATSAQQKFVDGLSNMFSGSAESDEDEEKMKKGVDILKEMQSARNLQSISLYYSVEDLHRNIRSIYVENGLTPFNFPGQDESQQNINAIDDSKQSTKSDSSENKYLKERICELEETVELLHCRNKTLQQEILKQRPPEAIGTVQLFHLHSGNTIKEIEADLKPRLNMHLDKVKLIKCNRLADVDSSKVLIVLSIIASRVGTDAIDAIKDIRNPAKTALVLIHIKEDHALPKKASSSLLKDEMFEALGGIFDMAFMHGKGIYQCEMNDVGFEGVYSFIKQNLGCTSV